MSYTKKSLAKVFAPAVLLTAALALPVDSLAALAPAPGFAAVQLDKDDKGKQKKEKKAKPDNPGQARKQQVQAQRQQQAAAQQQAQIRQQRLENQRLAQVRQQQIAAQRQAEIRRQRDLQIARERAAAQRYDTRYTQNRGRGGADRSVIAADGILENNGRCLILRGHQGQVYNLVGGTGGLREGEHVRLVGRLLYDRDSCGERMDVHQVQAIWADQNHRQTYFDHERDGSFNNSYRERYADRYHDNYDDDYRYDDYDADDYEDDDYDRNDRDDRDQLLAREGRLYNTRSACPVLRTDRGDYSLVGDLRNYREGDRVKVTGFLQNGGRCGGDSLRVGEITRR